MKKKNKNNKNKPNIKCNKSCNKNCSREKVYGDPNPVRPVSDYYNLQTGEIYPKIFFKESWWTRFKRFLGIVP